MNRYGSTENAHAALGRVVGRQRGLAEQSFDRRHIDDRAALALHARDRSLCAEHHAIEIDVERALPDLRRLLFKIGEMRDAGVVYDLDRKSTRLNSSH